MHPLPHANQSRLQSSTGAEIEHLCNLAYSKVPMTINARTSMHVLRSKPCIARVHAFDRLCVCEGEQLCG